MSDVYKFLPKLHCPYIAGEAPTPSVSYVLTLWGRRANHYPKKWLMPVTKFLGSLLGVQKPELHSIPYLTNNVVAFLDEDYF